MGLGESKKNYGSYVTVIKLEWYIGSTKFQKNPNQGVVYFQGILN